MVTCDTCATGELVERRKQRSSVAVVVIGSLLLVPSLLGVVFGTMGVVQPDSRSGGPGSCLGDPWILMLMMSVTFGTLGFCCVLRKTVLQCEACEAVQERPRPLEPGAEASESVEA